MSVKIIDKPSTQIDSDLLSKLKEQIHDKGQVVLHILFESAEEGCGIRIWPTSFLFDNHTDHRSKLVHAENISFYPIWTMCASNQKYAFTLVFEGLPKSCISFDFVEYCFGSPGAFEIRDIARNKQDVYFLILN